jgi:hypothetical protein
MKRLLTVALLASICLSARAQTNSLLGDLKTAAKDAIDSTNWAVYATAGHSLTKNFWLAGVGVAYNVTPVVAPIFGVDERWNGKQHVFSSVQGGLQLQLPVQPLVSLGISNFWMTPFVGDMAASGNGGNVVGNVVISGVDFDLYNWSVWALHLGGEYENCSGQGVYDANYLSAHFALSRALPEGIPIALRESRAHMALCHVLDPWHYKQTL